MLIWSRNATKSLCSAERDAAESEESLAETTLALISVNRSAIDSPAAIAAAIVESPVESAVLTEPRPAMSPRTRGAMAKAAGLSFGPETLRPVVIRSCVISSSREICASA